MNKYVAETGINWIFVYKVLHEDDEIIVLEDCGRFHKFDADRKFPGQIDNWIDFCKDSVYVGSNENKVKKLVEVKKTSQATLFTVDAIV